MSEIMLQELKTEEQQLLELLKIALQGNKDGIPAEIGAIREGLNWYRLADIARKHSVWSLLYDIVIDAPSLPGELGLDIEKTSRQTVLQSYRLLFLTKYVISLLRAHKIPAVVLKGVSAAAAYPVPELRKSGDVDVLVLCGKKRQQEADKLMRKAGMVPAAVQYTNYHVVYKSPDGIEIEIHYEMTRKLQDRRFNEAVVKSMKNAAKYRIRREIMGVALPVFNHPYQAYELLLHMMQHFLFAGFGLRLLCDWVVLWNREEWTEEEKALFWRLTGDCGIRNFVQQITAVCVTYLGLDADEISFMDLSRTNPRQFLEEIFSAEEFGDSAYERMVMMRGSGLTAYVREFHYQMQINYPKAGKIFLLWPGLWTLTLFRFIKNNRNIRHVSTLEVLKEAGRRSKFMENVKIFDR